MFRLIRRSVHVTGAQPRRAESREFLLPRGRDLLSPEHTDQTTGRPPWIEPVAGGIWFKCQTEVQLVDRLVSQNQAHAWAPRKQGDPGVGGPGLPLGTSWIAPRWFPRLDIEPPAQHHGYGRPRRRDADPSLVLYIAWARDVGQLTMVRVAELLYARPGERVWNKQLERVKRLQRDGREMYRERGALPWAAYEGGRPIDDWPADPVFLAALDRWKVEAQKRLQWLEAETREAAFLEPVTPETMKRDALELGLHIADPVGQRNPHRS